MKSLLSGTRILFFSFVLVVCTGVLVSLTLLAGIRHYASNIFTVADVTVTYTEQGFSPTDFQIPPNTRVAFKNVSGIPLWVASDPHPTHADYPEFDAQKEYQPGETYVFQFTKPGTFGFHNHKRSSDHGIVHVVDALHPLQSVSKTTASLIATRNRLLALLYSGKPNSIFSVIDAIQSNPQLSLTCHDVAHDLGHRAYQLYGFSGAMTYTNPLAKYHDSVQDICAGGYVHGVLEELFIEQQSMRDHPGDLCSGVPQSNRDSCFHGVGHALMFSYSRDVHKSLSGCRLLATSDMTRCFEGVWMELFWGSTDHSGPDSLGWKLDDPLRVCMRANNDEKPACFLYSSFGYFRTHPKEYAGAITLCTTSGLSESDSNFCLKGIGITMMSHFRGVRLERSEVYTNALSESQKRAFYQGVIGYAVLSGVASSELSKSCALLKTDTELCTHIVQAYSSK